MPSEAYATTLLAAEHTLSAKAFFHPLWADHIVESPTAAPLSPSRIEAMLFAATQEATIVPCSLTASFFRVIIQAKLSYVAPFKARMAGAVAAMDGEPRVRQALWQMAFLGAGQMAT